MTRAPERAFSVTLHDVRVGTLRARDDYSWFRFDQAYLDLPNRPVLGLFFEDHLHEQHASNMRLPAWFSNLLPEGRLRQWIADERGVSADRELELLAQVGHDLPGAVVVLPDVAGAHATPPSGVRAISGSASAEPRWRFSLAGVQLKFSMRARGERFTLPASAELGDWIVKLPHPDFPRVPVSEYACMRLAHAIGVDVPRIRLVHRDEIETPLGDTYWPHGDVYAFAIERFDRTPGGGRVHIEDLNQVRGFWPGDEEKYRGSFETVLSLIWRRHDDRSLIEAVRRLAFNVVVRNGDAHLKNWSLIYRTPQRPSLSPAYDLVPTALFHPSGDPERETLGLKLAGSDRFSSVSPATFDVVQTRLGFTGERLSDHAADVARRVREHASDVLASIGQATPSPLLELVQRTTKQLGA